MRRGQFADQREQVEYLRQMINAYRSTYSIIELARDIVFRQSQCKPKQKACHAVALAGWVQRNVTYVNEGEEQFQTPLHTLRAGYGDCDDFSTLIGALVEAVGIPSKLVAVAWGKPGQANPVAFGQRVAGWWRGLFKNEQFRHIFPRAVVATRAGIRGIPLDATLDQPVEQLTDPIAMLRARGLTPTMLVL